MQCISCDNTRWAVHGSVDAIFFRMKAGELARGVGINVQTLHYYERIGLLPQPDRSAANYRIYSDDALRRVQFIKKAQAIGFTLAEIKRIVELKTHGRAPCRQVVEIGEEHLREVDTRLAQLRAYRKALAQSLGGWREKNAMRRDCAGEFCDLIERLP